MNAITLATNQSNLFGVGALWAIVAAFAAVAAVIFIAIYVIWIIAYWKIFTKAGEKGWKALIPVYNFFIQIKLTWSKKFFWIIIGLFVLTSICNAIPNNMVTGIIGFAASVAAIVLSIISFYRLSKAFGHGGGYTVGLIFLPFIFSLILAFGSSEYQGNVYLEENKN